MAQSDGPADVYRALGVTPMIHAAGTTTRYGGTKLRPEVMAEMNKAATVMVDLEELNRQAGKVVAEVTGAEAASYPQAPPGGWSSRLRRA